CRLADRLDCGLDAFVSDDNLDLHLRKKIDDVLSAPVELGVALLSAETLCFGDGDTLQPDFLKGFLHFVQLERLDDRLDLFHAVVASSRIKTDKTVPLRQIESMKCASLNFMQKFFDFMRERVKGGRFSMKTAVVCLPCR